MGYNLSREGAPREGGGSAGDAGSDAPGGGTPANHLNELQILSGHTDIIRLLVKLDEFRYVYFREYVCVYIGVWLQ